MERQSSSGSLSSAGSAVTSHSLSAKLVTEADKEQQGLDTGKQQRPLTALFGALYTLAKEKINDTPTVAMLALIIDFLMIFTLILMPEYPWKADPHLWIYNVFYYIQIHLPIANKGYTFYLVIFYILVAVLFVSTAICIWVGWCFMNDSFPFLWPIKVARVVVSIFVSMFYIASLNIFLMACACKKEDGVWKHLVWHLDCFESPHIIHMAFSLGSGVVFFVVALLLVLGDHELEPMTKSLLAAPHSMCEMRALLCKTIITIADILFKPLPQVQVVLYAISCGLIFYYHTRMVPHYVAWVNVLRGGLNAVLAWVALIACILTYTVHWEYDDKHHPHWDKDDYRHSMTVLMAVGVPVMFAVGGGLCWWRLVFAWRTALKFKQLPADVKPKSIHRFMSEFDVEIASRIGRVWDEDGVPDPTALDLAENVLKAGVSMKPNSVFCHIVYSNFLIDCRHNNQSGWSMLEKAQKLGPNLSYQFSIFTRGQEHKQKAAGAGGDGNDSVDLVSYVEFQKNYRALLVYHKASLLTMQDFWRQLTRETISLERLGDSFKRMEQMESMADKTYKLVLDRYPKNAKLLKSYGKFLEHVKNNPWGAAKYYAEAEKQEELAENAAADLKIAALEGFTGRVDDKTAIITINAEGIIQVVNKATTVMFGYKKGELEGKNITCLMPPPFSIRHNSYLQNYSNSGKAKILDSLREVVALHKDRFVFPVELTVTKISGSGADALFMGHMNAIAPDPSIIQAWLLPSGIMLCADQSFPDSVGWNTADLLGKPFSSLGDDSAALDALVAQCAQCDEQQLADGAVQGQVNIKHKFADPVPVHIKFEMGGTEDQRLLVVKMRSLVDSSAMAVFDSKGKVLYANTPLASMLGYNQRDLEGATISRLLPPPYGSMHTVWVKEAAAVHQGKPVPGSCRSGATQVIMSSNGTPLFVKLNITPRLDTTMYTGASSGAGTTFIVKFERSATSATTCERKLSLLVGGDGSIIWADPDTPASVFGVDSAGMAGRQLAEYIDIFAEFASGERADLPTALAALMSFSASRPGSSWRVGVGDVHADQQLSAEEAVAAEEAKHKRIMLAGGMLRKSKLKPAIMMVTMPTEENVSEEVLTTYGSRAIILLELWRSDMLPAMAEVVEGCNLVRVEPTAGMVFGVGHTAMFNTNLAQWLDIPAETQLDDLLDIQAAKKAGSKAPVAGPLKLATGMHADKRPVSVTVQACVKQGVGQENRLMLLIRVVNPLMGLPGMLSAIIACETDSTGNSAKPSEAGVLSQEGGGVLPNDVQPAASDEVWNSKNTTRPSKFNMVTGQQGRSKAAAELATSPNDSEDEHNQLSEAKRYRNASKGDGGSEEHEVHAARAMDISSDESATAAGRHTKAKKPLTTEAMEAALAQKGARKAREWLDSSYTFNHEVDDDDDEAMPLPGTVNTAVEGMQQPHQQGRDMPTMQAEKEVAEVRLEGDAASESSASYAHSELVSDYSRGKRLRKLKRLLSSKAALQVVTGFKYKLILLALAILLLHVASFSVILSFIGKQQTYLKELGAAGEVKNLMQRVDTLSLVLEAAQRKFFFGPADVPMYAGDMAEMIARYETLHQGLYLGFGGLRPLDTPQLYSLWHEPTLLVTEFLDAEAPLNGSTSLTSLFNLGSMYASAAKDVQYSGSHNSTAGGAGMMYDRQWLFMQANAPTSLYRAYVTNENYMVNRAQRNLKLVLFTCIALMVIEGFCIIVLAVFTVVQLLRGISQHRQALFSVFLAIPNRYLRALASKSVSIEEDDTNEEEDGKSNAGQAASKHKDAVLAKQSRAQHGQGEGAGLHESADGDGTRAATGHKKQQKSVTAVNSVPDNEATVYVTTTGLGVPSSKEELPAYARTRGASLADRTKLFRGKHLEVSAAASYQLAWPFVLWGVLLLVLYGMSLQKFQSINVKLVSVKMMQRAQVQANRVLYLSAKIVLNPDLKARQELQTMLLDESEILEDMYDRSLYGGQTMEDALAEGSHDDSDGCLFTSEGLQDVLFRTHECLRFKKAGCVGASSPYYAVTRSAANPIMQRLIRESERLGRDPPASIDPHGSRFGFMWNAAWQDLNDGMSQSVAETLDLVIAAFERQRTTHIVLLGVMLIGGAMFLLLLLKPFLKHISMESRRCAELLVQLPQDLDVESMVAATWSVVKQERINAERSSKSFVNGIGATSLLSRLSYSLGYSNQNPRHPKAEGEESSPGMGWSGNPGQPEAGGKLFSPRDLGPVRSRRLSGPDLDSSSRMHGTSAYYAMEQEYKKAGVGRRGGAGSRGPKHSLADMGYAGAMMDEGGDDYGANRAGNAQVKGASSLSTGSYRAGSGGEALRLRSKGNKSPSSKRAVAPVLQDF